MKSNKGITLIALVITIIVMLILVGVTINMAVNGRLFNYAKNGVSDTQAALNNEIKLGEGGIVVNGKEYASIDEYLYGAGPELKYSVTGKTITISLADSYENYVANKSTPEKEQALAGAWGYNNIDDLIEGEGYIDRAAWETAEMIFNNALTYEDALNFACIDVGAFAPGFVTNSMNFISNISKEEKEQVLAGAWGYNNIDDLIEGEGCIDRAAWEDYCIDEWGVSTYEDALDIMCACAGCFANEYEEMMGGPVTVTDPSGNEHELYYMPMSEDVTSFTYTVAESGNYEFTATNEEGRTSEITVPVELQIKTFTINDENGNKIGDYEFMYGQTWEDFFGETPGFSLADGMTLYIEPNGLFWVSIVGREWFPRLKYDESIGLNVISRDYINPDVNYIIQLNEGEN